MPPAIRSARQLAVACARLAGDMKAGDVVVLDVGPLLYLTEYFVIATCSNPRQQRAIADELNRTFKKRGVSRLGEEGRADAGWLLVDFDNVVVHLFGDDRRRFYDLEGLWADAKRVTWGARRGRGVETEDAS